MRTFRSLVRQFRTALLPAFRIPPVRSLGLLFASLTILPLHAQWAVVDSGAIAEITTVASEVSSELTQLQQTYSLAQQMATSAHGMWRFQGPQNIWQDFQYPDQYGTLSGWITGVNSGNASAIQNAFAQNTSLAGADQSLTTLNSTLAMSRKALYSTREIMDGNVMAALGAIGQIHASAAQYQNAISQLQSDDENDDPDLQSELAVEQRTSNAAVLSLEAQQDTNQLLSALLQQQLGQNLANRSIIADDANSTNDLLQGVQTSQSLTNGHANSLQNWSISQSQ